MVHLSLPGGTRINPPDLAHVSCGLGLYRAGPAQSLTTAGEEIDDLQIDHDLFEVWKIPVFSRYHRQLASPIKSPPF